MFTSKQNQKSKQPSFVSQLTHGDAQAEGTSVISMLSPRNLMKFISTTIDEYNTKPKIYKPDISEQLQFLVSFQDYWLKIENQHKKYSKSKALKMTVNQKQERNEQLQLMLKLQRIPFSYFDEKFKFFFADKFTKLALRRKQQQVTQYLDEIEILIWNKTSKNPQKYFACVDNFDQTIFIVQKQLKKVQDYRKINHQRLLQVSKSQLRIKKIGQKKQRLQQVINYLQSIKKLKSVKEQSQQSFSSLKQNEKAFQVHAKLQIMQKIKKKELQIGSKIVSLEKIVNNLQFYREEIRSNIFQQFSLEIVELMNKLLAYDKNAWQKANISPQMLGKQVESQNNPFEESILNITILDQSCFGSNDFNHKNMKDENFDQDQIIYKNIHKDSQNAKGLVLKLNATWQAITKFDLYDEEEISELIMRQLVRHNVRWNRDLNEYLAKLFERFQKKEDSKSQSMKPILQEEMENSQDSERSKQILSTDEASQQGEEVKNQSSTPKKNSYFSSISQLTGINDLKNFKDLSQLKKKTLDTFKRFGNKKIGQVLRKATVYAISNVSQTDSYCKFKQKPQKLKPKYQSQYLSKVETKFFLKAVRFYYQILSTFIKFIKQNSQLSFFQNFLNKLNSFIEERVTFFFSLRQINSKTLVSDFLLYLNLIEYWCDICDDVYQNLSRLKSSITEEYLTMLQRNALVHELKNSINESTMLPYSISSIHISTFYYVFFWSSIQQIKQQETNDMSLTILRQQVESITGPQDNMNLLELRNFQNDLKIIDKKIIYKRDEFFICDSFIALMKQLEKYLQLREVLTEFNANIEEKICEIVRFYVWYNQKKISKTQSNVKPRTLKNLCVLYSTVLFLKIIFVDQLQIRNKKSSQTLDQFIQFFKTLEISIAMNPYLLIQQQISTIYQNNTLASQFQIPCKESGNILQILRVSLQQLKIYFQKQKIIKILETSIKLIIKNYFGYLSSLGKRGLLELRQFLPKLKEILLNYGFKSEQKKQVQEDSYVFMKELTEMDRIFKTKVSQLK